METKNQPLLSYIPWLDSCVVKGRPGNRYVTDMIRYVCALAEKEQCTIMILGNFELTREEIQEINPNSEIIWCKANCIGNVTGKDFKMYLETIGKPIVIAYTLNSYRNNLRLLQYLCHITHTYGKEFDVFAEMIGYHQVSK